MKRQDFDPIECGNLILIKKEDLVQNIEDEQYFIVLEKLNDIHYLLQDMNGNQVTLERNDFRKLYNNTEVYTPGCKVIDITEDIQPILIVLSRKDENYYLVELESTKEKKEIHKNCLLTYEEILS